MSLAATPFSNHSLFRIDTAGLPVLDKKQLGSIRHIDNLSRQLENDWRNMQGRAPMQEDYGAYRYQLAYMAFALALAHLHRLPAAPGYFKGTFKRLIDKMLHPEVWLYWRDSSVGKGPHSINFPALESQVDPVVRDNIMYSAYVQNMVLLYHAMFDDDYYANQGSIQFKFAPMLCLNDRAAVYNYDERSLNECIYWNMVQSGYLGVACEPYCVFQICNQVPILGFRLHDRLYGGNTAEEVIAGYCQAWDDFGGILDKKGHYTIMVTTYNKTPIPGNVMGPWSDAWCGMLMNMWNGDLVKSNYERQIREWLIDGSGDTISIKLPPVPEGYDLLEGALGDFGWIIAWASEMGDRETLNGMLAHADRFMNPKWENGGYFYPRKDKARDNDGNLMAVNPTTGNALMAYARLNVKDGLQKLFAQKWDDE